MMENVAKIKSFALRLLLLIVMLPFIVGFRTYSGGHGWAITRQDSTLYLNFCESIVPVSTDLPSHDPLVNQVLTHRLIVDSILNDYNTVLPAYFSLSDADDDDDFNESDHRNRTIEICTGSTEGETGGYAQREFDPISGETTGCKIVLSSKITDSATQYISTLTHEIGHCLGLDHPQETVHAIMSYYSSNDETRLMLDDKMGLIYLYPDNPHEAKQHVTWGSTCSTRD